MIAPLCSRCYFAPMDLDEASLAVGRVERALTRIEKLLVERSSQPVAAPVGGGVPPAQHAALRAEVTAVIGELDALITAAHRG
jgi:hypothetical protein